MARTATVRELRNNFPRVREVLESEGEVVITEQGTPKYRLVRYTRAPARRARPKDYLARLERHQPKPMSVATAAALRDANRGDR
jgi:antitoxin (DNA-binding transcriptional repressor) of toxin-antitoxin stability system